ncbi:hypothetical protein, partial [Amycolatopsis tucumanensis]|uniref:hypothetical protein n=1 Tax=Amycolatopsis tucumanensis TaxID=401106 RepID=UPI0031F16CEF
MPDRAAPYRIKVVCLTVPRRRSSRAGPRHAAGPSRAGPRHAAGPSRAGPRHAAGPSRAGPRHAA